MWKYGYCGGGNGGSKDDYGGKLNPFINALHSEGKECRAVTKYILENKIDVQGLL